MSEIDALRRHIEAQKRLNLALAAQVEGLLSQAARGDLRKLATTVLCPAASLLEKQFAATMLAQMVIESIPAPRPVVVPVVRVGEENEAC